MSPYRLRPQAVRDLEAIADFIALDNPTRAASAADEGITVERIVHGARRLEDLV